MAVGKAKRKFQYDKAVKLRNDMTVVKAKRKFQHDMAIGKDKRKFQHDLKYLHGSKRSGFDA